MKAIGRATATILVVVAAAVLVVAGIGPRTGRYRTMTVLTASMRPSMPEGAVVVSTAVPLASLRVGDVITYRIPVDDRRVVTHRIVRIEHRGIRPVVVTKGDANDRPDSWAAELKGSSAWKVRAVVPKAGSVLEDLRSPLVRRLVLPLLCGWLALLWLRDIWRDQDETPAADHPAATTSGTGVVRSTAALVALLSLGAVRARST